MWTSDAWETEEDVERDILLMAEYSIPSMEDMDLARNRIPDTILQYRKQMAQNKERTLNSDLDENASYIVSGRGKGIRDRVIRPGGIVDCHPSDEIELKKQIREVYRYTNMEHYKSLALQVSGFGYSNELIEQSIKAKGYDLEENTDDNSNFKLVSSSSSSRSSAETTPTKKKKVVSSNNNFNVKKTDEFPLLK
ncbi:hypothetical protein BDFB_005847 [Asbolus verrucosus]|uniref:Uncharacterized protein n=1 Tax=Asbolus verrucosus TaxID=1661398 RepID=A0A482WE36_ASBVE|nr:hypothetical protein BDFB_005847 [Asbolus verrucosus]